ncbi:MAG: site-specific integrase, partial [Brevundimonas sp.]|uniref:site-specific integrase n=1 Tax=Brevundimonas sp. TaxID=1871086 RepID=UPI002734D8DC
KILEAPSARTPAWAEAALAATTRDAHKRMLKIAAAVPADLLAAPLSTALSETLSRMRAEKKWTWATSLKNLAMMQGALALLPMYRAVTAGIWLKQDVVWTQTMQSVSRKAREEIPRTPKAMSPEVFLETLAKETRPQQRIALILMWFTAARPGCILQLQKEDVRVHDNRSISITFRRGKSVKSRGAYTVHTTAIDKMADEISAHIARSERRLFSIRPADLLPTFRLSDRTLEAKSIRRGSLQTMAAHGVPLATLMNYSGHTNEKTLLRYLNWGAEAGEMRATMAVAGQSLMPVSSTAQCHRGARCAEGSA